MAVERYWDDAKVGDEGVSPTMTVTGAMIDMYADVSGDHTPLHVDEEYARKSHFGERVAHGLFGLSVADGLKCQAEYRFLPGMSLGWNWDFLLPIKIGDTLHVKFRVGDMRRVEEQARLGHRDHPVRAHQPEGRSGPARRAQADDPAPAGPRR